MDNTKQNNDWKKTYLCCKYTKFTAGYGGLKCWSSGKLRREEVATRLEEKTVTNGNN